jgi:RimJ/RimL family protein N-acetyltransferase
MHDDILTPRLCLRLMPVAFLEAGLRDEWDRAEAVLGWKVSEEWRRQKRLMEIRAHDCGADPDYLPWSVRAIGLRTRGEMGEMIGHIGFHTRPDAAYLREFVLGGVELGYAVAAPYRRQGYAAEAVRGLMGWAHRRHGVDRFVVSISPENVASVALAAKFGFEKVGGHWDEIDGYEDVYALAGEPLQAALGAFGVE